VVGYIPDDVSSVHSSALGGVGVPSAYPPMFSGFTDSWPSLAGGRGGVGSKGRANGGAGSIAGDSVAASDLTDTNGVGSIDGKGIAQGGVNIGGGVSLNDLGKQTSLSQSDRLKRYVESGGRGNETGSVFGGSSASMLGGRMARGGGQGTAFDDDDVRSVSTAFASQVGLGNYD